MKYLIQLIPTGRYLHKRIVNPADLAPVWTPERTSEWTCTVRSVAEIVAQTLSNCRIIDQP